MAESSTEKKEDSLEDSLSSEEWTIIDQKETKADSTPDQESATSSSDVPKETVIAEDGCETEEGKSVVEHVEEGEEAGEKDAESDDVSILSDESESELVVEDGRIEKIEWQVDRQVSESRALATNSSGDGSSPHALISSTCLICSLIVVTLAIVIAGRVAHLQGDVANYAANVDIAEKLKELAAIEDKLKELSDVKQALDQIRISMPEMKKLKDQLAYQKNEKNKFKYSLEDYKIFENLNKQNMFNGNLQHDRLEVLEATYTNFCLVMNKVNSSNSDIQEMCRTPKVLSDMITFKKNLKRAFENTEEKAMPEKRMFVDAGRKLDLISESLLSDLSTMFTRFSFKMQERLIKFGFKLHQRLCLLNDFEKSDDKFLNILLDDDFFINNCNATADPVVDDYRSNSSHSKKSRYREMKKNSMDEPRKDDRHDYKNNKTFKKFNDAKEDYTNTSDESLEDLASVKSKGEIKHDNWKKNNHEKEKYYHGENNLNKNEKYEQNDRIDYRHKRESKSDHDKSFEKIEMNEEYNHKNDNKNDKNEYNNERKHDYKKDRDYGDREFERNKEYHSDREFERKKDYHGDRDLERKKDYHDSKVYNNREYRDVDEKFERGKRNPEHGNHYESKKNGDFEKKYDKKKNERHYDDTDSKFIIEMDNGSEVKVKNNYQEKQKYKNKEYILKPENFKESKYAKYDNHERRDRKDKYPTGEWQMQRGKAREKQRNSDWFFVRADLRRKARSSDAEDETEEEEAAAWRRSPPPNRKGRADNSRDKPDSFRKRVMRKVGRTWDFLNKEIRNYF